MRDNTLRPIVILAINTDSYENDIKAIQEFLPNYNYSRLAMHGVYKGVSELSYIIEVDDNLDDIQALANKYNQECILYLDNQREASLIHSDGKKEYIGSFRSASKQLAQTKDNYTFNPKTGVYYIVE